jgi:hypothetical protein
VRQEALVAGVLVQIENMLEMLEPFLIIIISCLLYNFFEIDLKSYHLDVQVFKSKFLRFL